MTRRSLSTSPFKTQTPPPVEQFAVNDRVTHDKYGLGSIVTVERGFAVVVDFGTHRRRIPSPYPKLYKL